MWLSGIGQHRCQRNNPSLQSILQSATTKPTSRSHRCFFDPYYVLKTNDLHLCILSGALLGLLVSAK